MWELVCLINVVFLHEIHNSVAGFQTRAHEWLFASEEGQWVVVESSKAARLIMVTVQCFGCLPLNGVHFLSKQNCVAIKKKKIYA